MTNTDKTYDKVNRQTSANGCYQAPAIRMEEITVEVGISASDTFAPEALYPEEW